jgi:hypothetical protein
MSTFSSASYMQIIKNKISGNVLPGKLKTTEEPFKIPTIKNYKNWLQYNYNIPQLKYVLSHYKLLIGGNKNELLCRLNIYFTVYDSSTKIQRIARGFMTRRFFSRFKEYNKDRNSCVNESDFYTFEPIPEIPYFHFVSLQDTDGKIYGFNYKSLKQYFKHSPEKKEVENPYNRSKFPSSFISSVNELSSKFSKYGINIKEEEEPESPLTIEQQVQLRVVKLFHEIDLLGNYSDLNWFMSLSVTRLFDFINQLYDIWFYRAQISQETKNNIYPPFGNPFNGIHIHANQITNINVLKNQVLELLERFVYFGIDRDSRSLGVFYVLGALTLVNHNAAVTLPWLYQSFSL